MDLPPKRVGRPRAWMNFIRRMLMSGKRSRDKGARGEREVIELLAPLWKLKRKRDQDAIGGEDLEGGPFTIEVKRQKKPSIYAAMKQAELAAMVTKKPPMVVTKADREPWLVTVRAVDFIGYVLSEYQRGGEESLDMLTNMLGNVRAEESN